MAKELNQDNFNEELNSKKIVVVDFNATWCGPCKTLGPIIDALATELEDDEDVSVTKLDVDGNSSVAAEYNVRGIPSIIFFKDGKEVKRLMGMQGKETLKAEIEALR